MFLALSLGSLILWACLLLAPWRPFSTREQLEADPDFSDGSADLSDVTAVVPARNEAARIGDTLAALCAQGRDLHVVVVDDESEDGTAPAVEDLDLKPVRVVRGAPLPSGWTGKVWAQAQAQPYLERPLVLLLDADVRLAPGLLAALKARLDADGAGLVSLMARLPMENFWERLLIPAFVFFFKLLYPFRLCSDPGSKVAAAAGGCVLMRRRALEDIGGFAALKDAVIDDCALARRVKLCGHPIWIGLTRSALGTRSYGRLADIWNMVARTAFTQLDYSVWKLAACTLIMALAFALPVAGVLTADAGAAWVSALAFAAMAAAYLPTLRFYGLGPAWALSLPLAGVLYLAMTLSSALRYSGGERARWRGRAYGTRG